jgi:DNA-binding NarL/FixJ family response regulator
VAQREAAQQEVIGLRLSGREHPRVLVLHQALLVAQVLAGALADQPELARVTPSDDVEDALRAAVATDVLVLDASVRGPDGSSPLEAFLALAVPPLVVVLGEPEGDPVAALLAGVRAWVPQDASLDQLGVAVREVAAGHVWMPTRLYAEVVERLVQAGGWPPRAAG